VQRCIRHKWENLQKHCPAHAHHELKRDWDAIARADGTLEARHAYAAFVAKWSRLVPAVVRSVEEAGLELLTFYVLPEAPWRSVRTTNALDDLTWEFRRRTKTQGSFATEAAGVTLLGELVAFGQIRLRRINGYRALPELLKQPEAA